MQIVDVVIPLPDAAFYPQLRQLWQDCGAGVEVV